MERAGSGLRPVIVFSHARLEDLEEMREGFQRVHICRRFLYALRA